jgi:hypothetical protein
VAQPFDGRRNLPYLVQYCGTEQNPVGSPALPKPPAAISLSQ